MMNFAINAGMDVALENGNTAKIVEVTENAIVGKCGGDLLAWTVDGTAPGFLGNGFDIKERVFTPNFKFSAPKWAKYIYWDENKMWMWSKARPTEGPRGWVTVDDGTRGSFGKIAEGHRPLYARYKGMPWKFRLAERP